MGNQFLECIHCSMQEIYSPIILNIFMVCSIQLCNFVLCLEYRDIRQSICKPPYCIFYHSATTYIMSYVLCYIGRFPSDEDRMKQWVIQTHRKDWAPTKHSRICSDHFFEKDLDRTGQVVRVRENAVPMRFKQFPPSLKKVILT